MALHLANSLQSPTSAFDLLLLSVRVLNSRLKAFLYLLSKVSLFNFLYFIQKLYLTQTQAPPTIVDWH